MQPTPNYTNTNSDLDHSRGSGSSGRERNRPGRGYRFANPLYDTPTGPSRQYPPSANEFPPLGLSQSQDGNVFGGGVSGATGGGHTITGILPRPAGTATTREGQMGIRMTQTSLARQALGPRSFSAGFAGSVGEFMGGRRGEMASEAPQVSSYLAAPQFSLRGNLLPPRSNPSNLTSRIANTPISFHTKSTPYTFTMTAAAGTSLTHRSAPYEIGKNFDRLRIQGAHLGLTNSPYFPKCKEDLIKHREERKNDARDAMNKRIRNKEEIMRLKNLEGCEGAQVKIRPAFGGKVFGDGLSGVLGQKTIWGNPSLDKELPERAQWPTLPELKQVGIRKMRLPAPKYKKEAEMAGKPIKSFAGDRVGLGRRRRRGTEETIMFDENEIKEMGDMKSLFQEIDG
ncbi:hypothetical protein SBOR_3878 [Sclerotinia borealis F-4128]|uniref:Uncharacterized protein n=1 Tax=Sclerotinia borealis (strain F-4128) TaxID=1432307 RepID=W9CM28_SCLBF|nr:hypothetical protein SBOR_3878 [Sclerotinia borealis F-4128]